MHPGNRLLRRGAGFHWPVWACPAFQAPFVPISCVYSNFRVAVMGADARKWLSPQENAALLHLLYSMLTLKLLWAARQNWVRFGVVHDSRTKTAAFLRNKVWAYKHVGLTGCWLDPCRHEGKAAHPTIQHRYRRIQPSVIGRFKLSVHALKYLTACIVDSGLNQRPWQIQGAVSLISLRPLRSEIRVRQSGHNSAPLKATCHAGRF